MSSKKEEKSQDAADKIKAATLSAAKGLSRAQAERAAAAAARNVNAYGQKEEGPSRWQERKEAKRQMYLMSTEKAVRLGERKDLKMSNISGTAAQCQKCFQAGHWTYECKNERVYISRPSRSQQLKNPKLRQKPLSPTELDDADVRKEQSPDKEEGEKRGKKSKRKHRSEKESDSDSEASVFDSQSESSSAAASDYSSEESASSESSSSDSEEERQRRRKRNKNKKQKKGRKKRYSSSSSESSDYESMSDSDSDDKSRRRKSKNRSHRR